MKRTIFLWIFIVLPLCGISKPIDSLIVEYGGGMTGQVTEYKIIQNSVSQLNYRLVRAGHPQKVAVTSKQLKKVYKNAQNLIKKKEGFDKPGNMYKSITIYSKGKKVTYKWGDVSFETPGEVKDLYDQILTLIKKLKFQ